MSTLICEVGQNAPSACPEPFWIRNPYRLVSLMDVYQVYADTLLKLFDALRDIEIELEAKLSAPASEYEVALADRFINEMANLGGLCGALQLSSAGKQVQHILKTVLGQRVAGSVVAAKLSELRRRISEDLEDHVYYCVPEDDAKRLFKRDENERYVFKTSSELMDPAIVKRFPTASDDIEATYQCFMFECYPASMFHLMRVLEVAVLELGDIAGLKDSKPSWGSVLNHVERLVLRTKYEDLPESVKPHRWILEAVLPHMQAIQRAWRNKFAHVDNKIIPTEPISEKVATQILTAVEAFMHRLALDLPKSE